MSNWSTSNYRQRKAQRLNNLKPSWQTNPETGEAFYLRRIGAMAYTIAGHMPHTLTAEAVEGWRKEGVETPKGDDVNLSQKDISEGTRNLQMMARVVQDACVIPVLCTSDSLPTHVDASFLMTAAQALKEQYEDFNEDEFKPTDLALDPAELEDSDLLFIFRYATGQVGNPAIPLNGGNVMQMTDLKSLRKKPGRRSRTGTGG